MKKRAAVEQAVEEAFHTVWSLRDAHLRGERQVALEVDIDLAAATGQLVALRWVIDSEADWETPGLADS